MLEHPHAPRPPHAPQPMRGNQMAEALLSFCDAQRGELERMRFAAAIRSAEPEQIREVHELLKLLFRSMAGIPVQDIPSDAAAEDSYKICRYMGWPLPKDNRNEV